MTHQIETWNLLYKIKLFLKVLMVVMGLKIAKNHQHRQFLAHFSPFLRLLQPLKHYQTIFIL